MPADAERRPVISDRLVPELDAFIAEHRAAVISTLG
jgi:hypothetical protein